MRCFLAALALALCFGCSRGKRPAAEPVPDLRLAVVTDLKGYLEPCGCTSNPLGGIDRLAAQVKQLRESGVPVLLLMAGDVFFDTATIEPARVDQAQRNAKTLAGILSSMQVTAVLPGNRDRAQPPATLEGVVARSSFPWLAMNAPSEVWTAEVGGHRVSVIGVRPGATREEVAASVGAAEARADVTVALIDGTRRDANRVGAIPGVDFVVHGGLDQDDAIPPRQVGRAWALHASRQGQGLVVVDVHLRDAGKRFEDRSDWSRSERAAQLDRQIGELAAKIERWDASGSVDEADLDPQRARLAALREDRALLDAPASEPKGSSFVARFVPLPKKSPRDGEVEKLMREHDKAVNEANRAAFASLKPPPLGPEDVAYVGSAACSGCHQEAYAWWQAHPHGVAYRTLQERNKEYNLDCVGCHVTGYQQPGGSTVTHNLDGALVNVGCESCHGPGGAHTKNPEVAILRNTPESTCVTCHNAEHSDLFDYEAYMKTLVVPGHGLPVKTP